MYIDKLLKVILAVAIVFSNLPYVNVIKAENIDNVNIDSGETGNNKNNTDESIDNTLENTDEMDNVNHQENAENDETIVNTDQQEDIENNETVSSVDNQNATETIQNNITTVEGMSDTVGLKTTKNVSKVSYINDFKELQEAVKTPNHTIILNGNIQFTDSLEINQQNIVIDGANKQLDLNGKFVLTVKSENFELSGVQFKNYNATAMKLYNAKNASLKDVTFEGNSLSLDKEERSKIGLDIAFSTTKLENITLSNHLYKGIQVRQSSTVEIISSMKHTNDAIHMQLIVANDEKEPSVITDPNKTYTPGSEYAGTNNKTVDYYITSSKTVNTVKDFIEAVAIPGMTVTLGNSLTLEKSDVELLNSNKQIEITKNVVVDGAGHTINLNQVGSVLLKGQDISIKNVIIENSASYGINIYNSRNVLLDNVTAQYSKEWGVFVNGSIVGLKNIKTLDNTSGGVKVTRSRTLRLDSHFNSYVEVVGTITQKESNINVGVVNHEMLDGTTANNQFVYPNNMYTRYDNDTKYSTLSQYYLDFFEIPEEDWGKTYGDTEIDFMLNQQQIDVTTTQEVKDENGNVIQLKNDGITDNADNLEKFIAYAALNGKTLYFPEGTYVISRDIDLSKINLPALSNFTLKGSEDGLSIFDGTSQQGRMLKFSNATYHSIMNYVKFDNLVFNNIAVEMNGPYKKGVSLTNNAFINGKYTAEYAADGSLYKVTLNPYIHIKNNKYVVENNVFLRGDNYPGRGIATYRTTNTSLKNNYFGILDGLNDASKMLPSQVIKKATLIKESGLVDHTPQGNFMTAINNERYDKNVLIQNNYFNMDKTRNIIGDFDETVLVSGINVAKDGQRRDHIIYSKSYTGLNIVGNYFEGMENSAAGGVKIRNGKNAYIGSNNFNDVGLLTYIYNDLTPEEVELHDTIIYNNLFQQTTNMGKEGTGILYYQSFFDTEVIGDVRNFVMLDNKFVGNDDFRIIISHRPKQALANNQFIASGNVYEEDGTSVKYHSGNVSLNESTKDVALGRIAQTSGYYAYHTEDIPMTPHKVITKYLKNLANTIQSKIDQFKQENQVGTLAGQYSRESIKKIEDFIVTIKDKLAKGLLTTQSETNTLYTELETMFNNLVKNDYKPQIPDLDFDNGMNGYPDEETKPANKNETGTAPDSGTVNNPATGYTTVLGYVGLVVTAVGVFLFAKKKKTCE